MSNLNYACSAGCLPGLVHLGDAMEIRILDPRWVHNVGRRPEGDSPEGLLLQRPQPIG